MAFLTNFGVTEIFCNFRLVLEGRAGKEVPESSRLGYIQKFLASNFALSDAEDNTSGALNRGGIADLLLLRTLLTICQKSQNPSFWKGWTLFIISMCKGGSFKNPFTTNINLSKLYFRFRRFILLVQMKKVISVSLCGSTSICKPRRWVKLKLIFAMRDICINSNLDLLRKFTNSSRSTEFKDILPKIDINAWNVGGFKTF